MKVEEFDAIVVGVDLSDLRAALELSQKWKVAVISKIHPVRSVRSFSRRNQCFLR